MTHKETVDKFYELVGKVESHNWDSAYACMPGVLMEDVDIVRTGRMFKGWKVVNPAWIAFKQYLDDNGYEVIYMRNHRHKFILEPHVVKKVFRKPLRKA